MLIQWSEEDQVYVVSLPEFGGAKTHGTTYESAARSGREVLGLLVDTFDEQDRPLPTPEVFRTLPRVREETARQPRKRKRA